MESFYLNLSLARMPRQMWLCRELNKYVLCKEIVNISGYIYKYSVQNNG